MQPFLSVLTYVEEGEVAWLLQLEDGLDLSRPVLGVTQPWLGSFYQQVAHLLHFVLQTQYFQLLKMFVHVRNCCERNNPCPTSTSRKKCVCVCVCVCVEEVILGELR